MLGVLFAILILGLLIWGFWRFYTNGTRPADPKHRPDLSQFAPPPPTDTPSAQADATDPERP